MSKILVPLNNKDNIDEYIEAGADEFYIGFYDDKWTQKFGEFNELNRLHGFGKKVNRYTIDEIGKIGDYLYAKEKDLFVTFNAPYFSTDEYQYIKKYFSVLSKHKVTGVIVSTPELIKLALEYHLVPVASTICGIYNSYTAKYYYDIGVRRMILPRDLLLDELESIIKKFPDVHFEVFLIESGCRYSDGCCLGFHRDLDVCANLMLSPKKVIQQEKLTDSEKKSVADNLISYNTKFHTLGTCGECAVYRFEKMGVGSYKIVGRGMPKERVIDDIMITNNNIILAEECKSEEEFIKKVQTPLNAESKCRMGLNCYYPEVKFK